VAKFAGVAQIPAALKKDMATVQLLGVCRLWLADSANAPSSNWTLVVGNIHPRKANSSRYR
jgi:hypothetical protein